MVFGSCSDRGAALVIGVLKAYCCFSSNASNRRSAVKTLDGLAIIIASMSRAPLAQVMQVNPSLFSILEEGDRGRAGEFALGGGRDGCGMNRMVWGAAAKVGVLPGRGDCNTLKKI